MLTSKKLFFLFLFLIAISTYFSAFSLLAEQEQGNSQEDLINQIEYLFQQNSESLHYDEVINLSNKIIPQQSHYPNEIIAKTYLLLASIALNKGELETAFQFTRDGLAKTNETHNVRLCLQIKLAEILLAQKAYQKLLILADRAIKTPETTENTKYLLFALSYRSVAFSQLSQHGKALADLEKVQDTMQKDPDLSQHIALISILANAYFNLDKFQTALNLQLKILALRFNLKQLDNVDQTYYQIGNAYLYLKKYNDAYNAYWEAEKYAKIKGAPIHIAYAKQGLAATLYQQKQYQQATAQLLQAKQIFNQQSLSEPYLETLISLAQISSDNKQKKAAYSYLSEAEKISEYTAISDHYSILYQLLANMYFTEKSLDKAYFWQKKYSQTLEAIRLKKQNINTEAIYEQSLIDSTKTQQLALELAEKSELASVFSTKYKDQKSIIFVLVVTLVAILLSLMFIWLRRRTKQSRNLYDAHNPLNVVITDPIKTKQLYQTSFNMARKYSYPLTLGYINLTNWKELTFKFNKTTITEVSAGIAELMHEQINDFESVGLINEGEYLLFFPHQSLEEANVTMQKILQALQLRFFANLGEFSVTLSYSLKTPDFQDIDPYIFLSQLSAAMKSI